MSVDLDRLKALLEKANEKGLPARQMQNAGVALVYALLDAAPALIAELDAARALRKWLDSNTTFYDTAESSVPVLAEVPKRIWYHATDDSVSYPFSAMADAATKESDRDG